MIMSSKTEAIENVIFLFERLGTAEVRHWKEIKPQIARLVGELGGDAQAFAFRTRGDQQFMCYEDMIAINAYLIALVVRHLEAAK